MIFTNLDKIYYPQSKITKSEVVDYYRSIAKYILPHLKDRPLTLKRYPDGIKKPPIYQRHLDKAIKDAPIETVKLYVADKKTNKDFLICDSQDALLYLAQLGTIELHPWYSTINPSFPDKTNLPTKFTSARTLEQSVLNYPDAVVFDLDPYADNFNQAVEVAKQFKKMLDKLKLTGFIKTSGQAGLHIYLPIERRYTYEQTRCFATELGELLIKAGADITMEERKNKRGRKLFLDVNQNALSKSLVSVYSLRASTEATVSFPVEWGKLTKIKPSDFNLKTVLKLLNKTGDPWIGLLKGQKNKQIRLP